MPRRQPAVGRAGTVSRGWQLELLTCEHASNAVPDGVALGVRDEVLHSHVAWDPGSAEIARALAEAWPVPLLAGAYSRLVVDLNRDPDGPHAVPEVAFGESVPGNAALPPAARAERIARWHAPFRRSVREVVAAVPPWRRILHLSLHSFTPTLVAHGRTEVRTYPVGVLFDPDRRAEAEIADRLLGALRRAGWDARANQPYLGTGEGTTSWLRRELPAARYAGLEIEWNHGGADDARARLCRDLVEALSRFAPREAARYRPSSGGGVQVSELNDTEREVFLALLAHLAEADSRIDPGEVLEIDALAEEMGIDDMQERLMRARGATPTREALLAALEKVERPDARELVRTVLFDLAQSDGERTEAETELLEAVTRAWRS
ncbi:MAG: N-formylglutamate amidohydrolase [Myxococcota bacterium]